jgi:hypothetical protein
MKRSPRPPNYPMTADTPFFLPTCVPHTAALNSTPRNDEWATEIKVRAERRAGEMLAEMPKHNSAARAGWKTQSQSATTLEDLGINKSQSSRWQKLDRTRLPRLYPNAE